MGYSTKFVSYDLKSQNKNYDDLYSYLKSFPEYKRINESFWMVNTTLAPKELRDQLSKYLDNDDLYFVSSYGKNSTSAWYGSIDSEVRETLVHEDN
ncbi:hypothetical protein [Pediococcus pentosaceus]|uniref:hypothetical protein n=1 Tax=Pediococcus pentosaceus TaxID=1255 RepID=UPI0015A065F1|nr:hypothetical protein [Pediococcus pentosaceus]NVZ00193.1 hypothetical protein [Pediococcus pentosaceus]